ncbi:MAG: hypothetical protein E6R03_00135 [Hyphomicrobiaceae bacterium]|nr:MAG: hypothetical protein E6R03_00135 [Hyphomicrobiaceae bacterium]
MGKTKPAPSTEAPLFYDIERDGITFSLLSTFLDCREKARLHLAGWAKIGGSVPMLFGNVVHGALEHAYRAWRDGEFDGAPPRAWVHAQLNDIERTYRAEHTRISSEEEKDLQLTLALAAEIVPRYFSYWHKNDTALNWTETEQEFKIPVRVELPPKTDGGRWHTETVDTFLRGKIDGVFMEKGVFGVFETKTKGRVNPGTLLNILGHNLQVGIYLWAVKQLWKKTPRTVLYNLVRRPQLRQKQSEALVEFAKRVGDDIDERPDFYFMRIRMSVSDVDLGRFDNDRIDLLRDFVLWWRGQTGHYKNSGHCENKYGDCPFLQMCGGGGAELYYIRPKVFSELGED